MDHRVPDDNHQDFPHRCTDGSDNRIAGHVHFHSDFWQAVRRYRAGPRLISGGSLLTGFSTLPALWLINNSGGNITTIWLSIIIPFGIFYATVYGPEAALFCDLFPARVRYTGISFVYQFSGIFASGLTPIIATALWKIGGGSADMIAAYVIFSGIVSALSARWIGKQQEKAIIAEQKTKTCRRRGKSLISNTAAPV